MTPEDEREAQYADELVAALPQDAREWLLQDWAHYLVEREQRDLSGRHRDFILGWVACYDSYGLRPRLVRVTFKDPEATPRPRPAARRSTLYERAMEAQNKRLLSVQVQTWRDPRSGRTETNTPTSLDPRSEPSATPPPS
jgi:hypothetical protein